MAAYDPLSPEVVYAVKGNIKYPLSQAMATASESLAQSRLNDALAPVTATVPAGTIKVAL